MKLIAFVGNPNSGKTTIFNKLTKSNEIIGNFSGVTVDVSISKYKDYNIVDLPGIYSLIPYTKEEVVTLDYFKNNNISLIVNVIDANMLNRSLYLTSRLMDLDIPMVIILTKYRCNIDIKVLERILGINIYICNKELYKRIDSIITTTNTNYNKFKKLDNVYLDINYRYNKIDEITNRVIITNKNKDVTFIKNKYLSLITSIILFILVYYISINIIGNKLISIVITYLNMHIEYTGKF